MIERHHAGATEQARKQASKRPSGLFNLTRFRFVFVERSLSVTNGKNLEFRVPDALTSKQLFRCQLSKQLISSGIRTPNQDHTATIIRSHDQRIKFCVDLRRLTDVA